MTDSQPERPVCGDRWRSDRSHICIAPAVESGGRCLAHHHSREALLAQQAAHGAIDLTFAEIDPDLVDNLCCVLACSETATGPVRLDAFKATFTGPARFGPLTFTDDVRFLGATFTHDAMFEGATFNGHAVFSDATFTDAWFQGATFNRDAWYVGATFRGDAWFEDATFGGDAQFEHATFATSAWFNRARFTGLAWFAPATFVVAAHFAGATLGAELRLHNHEANRVVDLSAIALHGPATIALSGSWQLTFDHVVLRDPLTIIATTDATAVASMTNTTLLAPLTLGVGLALTTTAFTGTTGLDQLRFRADPAWARWRRRRTLADEHTARHPDRPPLDPAPAPAPDASRPRPATFAQVETLYRQLRAGLETSKAAPAAADFYYGELEMRRLAARRWSGDWFWLPIYKWFGGYGVRAWRPFAWYLALLAATIKLLHARTNWFATNALTTSGAASIGGDGGLAFTRYSSIAAFVTRNSISVFTAPADGLTPAGTFLFISERFIAVTLLALGVLAVRARVQR